MRPTRQDSQPGLDHGLSSRPDHHAGSTFGGAPTESDAISSRLATARAVDRAVIRTTAIVNGLLGATILVVAILAFIKGELDVAFDFFLLIAVLIRIAAAVTIQGLSRAVKRPLPAPVALLALVPGGDLLALARTRARACQRSVELQRADRADAGR